MQQLHDNKPKLEYLIPVANATEQQQVEQLIVDYAHLPIHVFIKNSQPILSLSDAALITSGTAALEAMFCQTPMVVSYKANPITFAIIWRMLNTPFVSLPNIIAGKQIVEEILQQQATVDRLSDGSNIVE